MNDHHALTTQLQSCIDQYGIGDVLVILAQICADKALDDYLPHSPEAQEVLKHLREGSHYGTPLGRAAEWIKMADRIYELSHFYDPAAECPNFVHPPWMTDTAND
jgi:hypothetical protein